MKGEAVRHRRLRPREELAPDALALARGSDEDLREDASRNVALTYDVNGNVTKPVRTVDELLTVYTIVNALTVNLPAVTHVQILIDGKEVDTLAGHVDLRHPLSKNMEWIVHDTH